MILDFNLQFTGTILAPTDTPTTGTQTSTNIIDLHDAGIPVLVANQGARDMGIGDMPSLKIHVVVTVAFTLGTSLQINLQGAPDNGSGAPGTFATFASTPVYAEASLIIGARLFDQDMPRPPLDAPFPRFLQLQYVSVGTHTTGQIRGNIVIDRMDQVEQANAFMGGYPPGIVIAN